MCVTLLPSPPSSSLTARKPPALGSRGQFVHLLSPFVFFAGHISFRPNKMPLPSCPPLQRGRHRQHSLSLPTPPSPFPGANASDSPSPRVVGCLIQMRFFRPELLGHLPRSSHSKDDHLPSDDSVEGPLARDVTDDNGALCPPEVSPRELRKPVLPSDVPQLQSHLLQFSRERTHDARTGTMRNGPVRGGLETQENGRHSYDAPADDTVESAPPAGGPCLPTRS